MSKSQREQIEREKLYNEFSSKLLLKNDNVELLLNSGVNPNESYLAEYPIYIAAKKNNFIALKLLYNKGAKLDRGFNSELYEAIKNKNPDMAQFLLDRKANINYRDL